MDHVDKWSHPSVSVVGDGGNFVEASKPVLTARGTTASYMPNGEGELAVSHESGGLTRLSVRALGVKSVTKMLG